MKIDAGKRGRLRIVGPRINPKAATTIRSGAISTDGPSLISGSQGCGLIDGKREIHGSSLDRWREQLPTATGDPVRLGDYQCYLDVGHRSKCTKCGTGELRCSHVNDSNWHSGTPEAMIHPTLVGMRILIQRQ
jgi:hypothetical protein